MIAPRPLLILVFFAALPGCATVEGAGILGNLSPAVHRGRDLSETVCSTCHAIAPDRFATDPAAPPFAGMMMKHDRDSLDRELEAISEVGHYRMPPTPLSPSERRDIVAYIESLN